MKLYKVKYKQWNGSFSDMYDCEELSIGENKTEAIARVKEITDKDAKGFEAEAISNVFGYKIILDDESSQKSNKESYKRIETQTVNNCNIIAEVDNEDNSIDIAINVDEAPLVTINVATDGNTITIRKWVGFGNSIDESININDIDELHQNTEMTL